MIIRTPIRDRYVVIAKNALEDERLSWKARGILAYLLTKPDHWQVYVKQLAGAGPDGRTAVLSALRELEECGYLVRRQGHKDDGTFDRPDIEIHESPQVATEVGKPDCGADQGEPAKVQVATEVGLTATGKPAPSEEGREVSNDLLSLPSPEPSEERRVLDAIDLIAHRRVQRARHRTRITSVTAYHAAVLADVSAELSAELARRAAMNPTWTADDLATMLTPEPMGTYS